MKKIVIKSVSLRLTSDPSFTLFHKKIIKNVSYVYVCPLIYTCNVDTFCKIFKYIECYLAHFPMSITRQLVSIFAMPVT